MVGLGLVELVERCNWSWGGGLEWGTRCIVWCCWITTFLFDGFWPGVAWPWAIWLAGADLAPIWGVKTVTITITSNFPGLQEAAEVDHSSCIKKYVVFCSILCEWKVVERHFELLGQSCSFWFVKFQCHYNLHALTKQGLWYISALSVGASQLQQHACSWVCY